MESAETGTDEAWSDLQDGIEEIYLDVEHLTMSRYMALYTHAMNLICRMEPLDRTRGHHATRFDLYKYVNTFLHNHVTRISNAANDLTTKDILLFYSSQWERFKSSSKVLSHVIPFDNLKWPRKGWPEGLKRVHGAYQLSLMTWRDVLLSESGRKVRDGVLDLIEDERRGKPVNISVIRGIVSSFVELDLSEEPSNTPPVLEVYKTAFESRFLENTERFYKRLEAELFESNPVSECVKNIQQRLAEEERRVELYLHASTLKPLQRILWEVLIEKHSDLFYAEFKNLLQEGRHDVLASMYQLMSRASDAISNLADMFKSHVRAEGQLAVERLGDMASEDPTLYVDTLVRVYRKHKIIVLTAFANDTRFVLPFHDACRQFINNNAVTLLSQSPRKSPELFAVYCDTLLKRSSEAPQEFQLDDFLDGIISMLDYIDDKDAFQKFSTETLAKRLVQHLSVCEDMEASLRHKLRRACGYGYVWTLRRMLRDLAASQEMNEQFMTNMKSSKSFSSDVTIHVLASGMWPFRQSSELILPQELERIVQCFTAFYSGLHSARKLQWLHNVSKVEIATHCFRKGYTFQASTFQTAVLLQYNHGLSFKVQEIHEKVGIDMGVLQQVLKSLVACKLLIRRGRKTKESGELRPDTVVSLSEGYYNEKLRVDINAPLNEDLDAQRGVTKKMIDDERKILVQAAIVRTMKVRRTLKEEELIVEIVSQLQPRFKPSATFIKECITNLIEKEYLKKDSSQPNTYSYLA
ncbi:hypothetical protein HPB48_023023 [Haemaphysalis longicornis]|uniref:Cullin family profile domain-containing protein n=1 Tax=Haemaphysalis longicornis TaxID=44386 RepID=A0A9J6FXR2_HAELO|nr:hypothetical protein HPB48_023023 [Haemaphysalis longicornis]